MGKNSLLTSRPSGFLVRSPPTSRRSSTHHSSDPAAGSPFGTGYEYAYTHEYKRIMAIAGDVFFQTLRRQLLDKFSLTRPAYNICAS